MKLHSSQNWGFNNSYRLPKWWVKECRCFLQNNQSSTLRENVCIRSYSGPHFPAFGLNTERYGVSLRIQSECAKMQTRITLNTDTFRAVQCLWLRRLNSFRQWKVISLFFINKTFREHFKFHSNQVFSFLQWNC